MQRWIPILSGLLVLQLVLALVLNLAGEEYGAFQADEKLLAFDKQLVFCPEGAVIVAGQVQYQRQNQLQYQQGTQ